jgi:O-acetyl-ADP-ribose deacetylase (regulator of RNase III)
VGPVYEDGNNGEPEILASAYKAALQLAKQHNIRSIAFPCISTGVYGYPKPEAREIAVATVTAWLDRNQLPEKVIFCCFETEDVELYAKRLKQPTTHS